MRSSAGRSSLSARSIRRSRAPRAERQEPETYKRRASRLGLAALAGRKSNARPSMGSVTPPSVTLHYLSRWLLVRRGLLAAGLLVLPALRLVHALGLLTLVAALLGKAVWRLVKLLLALIRAEVIGLAIMLTLALGLF